MVVCLRTDLRLAEKPNEAVTAGLSNVCLQRDYVSILCYMHALGTLFVLFYILIIALL